MCVLVQYAARNSDGDTTYVGGRVNDSLTWQLSVADMVGAIETEEWFFFTQAPTGELALLKIRQVDGQKILVSSPDGVVANNLGFLPRIPKPAGGAWPPWPLSIVSILPLKRILVNRVIFRDRVTSTNVTIEPPPKVETPGQISWTWNVDLSKRGRQHRSIVLDVQLPWPATYYVAIPWLIQAFKASELTQTKRDALEAAGTSYFTWDFGPSAFNAGGPFRMTEIRIAISLSQRIWDMSKVTIVVGFNSLNPVSQALLGVNVGAWTLINFQLDPIVGPDPQPEPDIPTPNEVGLTVQKALDDLSARGFHIQLLPSDFLYGPPFVDWLVVSQDPKAGTPVKSRTTVWIFASPNGRRVLPSAQNLEMGAVLKRLVRADKLAER